MTKYLTATTILIAGMGEAVTFTDTAIYTGGSTAASQIKQRHDVNVKQSNGVEYYIPFHAIAMATFTRTTTTAEDPKDTFCGTEESSASDAGSGGENANS